MGLRYRRRIQLPLGFSLNFGHSPIPSISWSIGRVTLNSRGSSTVRLSKGYTYRTSPKKQPSWF